MSKKPSRIGVLLLACSCAVTVLAQQESAVSAQLTKDSAAHRVFSEVTSATTVQTEFGTSIQVWRGDKNFAAALARETATFGVEPVNRIFYSGAPSAWPGDAGMSGQDVVVSFKYKPANVIAGKDNAALRQWFDHAPTDREIYWSYWHEPEDDIRDGRFTAAQYRAAWRHVAAIADRADNVHLHATLILMKWTLNPASHRNWHDYYAGPAWIDDIAFDGYDYGNNGGSYTSPSDLYSILVDFGRTTGIPWGISEMGTRLMASDPKGTERATWLRAAGSYLRGKAIFACYYDSKDPGDGLDYRLRDTPSQNAWRSVVQG